MVRPDAAASPAAVSPPPPHPTAGQQAGARRPAFGLHGGGRAGGGDAGQACWLCPPAGAGLRWGRVAAALGPPGPWSVQFGPPMCGCNKTKLATGKLAKGCKKGILHLFSNISERFCADAVVWVKWKPGGGGPKKRLAGCQRPPGKLSPVRLSTGTLPIDLSHWEFPPRVVLAGMLGHIFLGSLERRQVGRKVSW